MGDAAATGFGENRERMSCLISFLSSGTGAVGTGAALKSKENRSSSGAFAINAGAVPGGGNNADWVAPGGANRLA